MSAIRQHCRAGIAVLQSHQDQDFANRDLGI
jgi:hypothetical protein